MFQRLTLFILILSSPLISTVLTREMGQLENGVHYSIQHTPVSDYIHIQMIFPSGTLIETDETEHFHSLLAQTLFWGTDSLNRNEVLNRLQELGINGDPVRLITVQPNCTVIQFTLPKNHSHLCTKALQLLQNLIHSPTLSNEAIEIERNKILVTSPSNLLRYATPEKIRAFYQSHMQAEPPALQIEGALNIQRAKSLIEKTNASPTNKTFGTVHLQHPFTDAEIESLEESLSHTEKQIQKVTINGKNYLIVDGKIVMQPPSFYQTISFHKWFGWGTFLLSATALGGAIWILFTPLVIPTIQAIAIFCSLLGFGTSIYTLSKETLHDPSYIISIREKHLEGTFTEAYRKGHIPFVLTPLEARQRMIIEHTENPSIKLLSSKYNLWSTLFDEMLSIQELNSLKRTVNSYRFEMNELIAFNDAIEEAFAQALAPAREKRDALLLIIEANYETNHFVIREKALETQRDQALANLEADFKQQVKAAKNAEPPLGEQQLADEIAALKQWKNEQTAGILQWFENEYYPDISAGITVAKAIRSAGVAAILAEYDAIKEQIAQDRKYYADKNEFHTLAYELTQKSNLQVQEMVSSFPLYPGLIEDIRLQPGLWIELILL